ncbi:MAG TPA: hypothetical protein VFR94_19140 [Nitrososphaeraceae archaeon]|nr:hypothetical protein [Nitrososphaeraceae archaeon]
MYWSMLASGGAIHDPSPTWKVFLLRSPKIINIKSYLSSTRANRYNQTIEGLVKIILGQFEYYERLGYDKPKEGGSF